METHTSNSQSLPGNESGKSDFLNKLHAGALTPDLKEKKMAAQYSLSLIKASVDHLITPEKEPDMNATLEVINEFGSENKKEISDKYPCSNEMLKELIKDHERIILQLKKTVSNYYERYKDSKISNFLNGIIEEHKMVAWTLKRYMVR